MSGRVARLVQITREKYSESEIESLEEILAADYRGSILQEFDDDDDELLLVSFTFPRYGRPDRAKDGLRYMFMRKCDVEEM